MRLAESLARADAHARRDPPFHFSAVLRRHPPSPQARADARARRPLACRGSPQSSRTLGRAVGSKGARTSRRGQVGSSENDVGDPMLTLSGIKSMHRNSAEPVAPIRTRTHKQCVYEGPTLACTLHGGALARRNQVPRASPTDTPRAPLLPPRRSDQPFACAVCPVALAVSVFRMFRSPIAPPLFLVGGVSNPPKH